PWGAARARPKSDERTREGKGEGRKESGEGRALPSPRSSPFALPLSCSLFAFPFRVRPPAGSTLRTRLRRLSPGSAMLVHVTSTARAIAQVLILPFVLLVALVNGADAQGRGGPAGPAPVSGIGPDGKLGIIVRDGMLQPVLEFADTTQFIRQSLWVE